MQHTSYLDDIRKNVNFEEASQTHVDEYSKLMQLYDFTECRPTESEP